MIEITAKKTYGERVVLDITSLKLEDSKKYALIGANGSGKSTLLKCIAGIIAYDGDIKNLTENYAYMPQNNYAFSLSVKNNILIARPFTEKKKLSLQAEEIMGKLDLTGLKDKNASRLSGGETQKIALARVLITKRDILLLDEPTSSMDINSAVKAEIAIAEYCSNNKTTLIFATHSMQQAKRLADEIIFMKDGKVIEKGEPDILLAHPSNIETENFINFNR